MPKSWRDLEDELRRAPAIAVLRHGVAQGIPVPKGVEAPHVGETWGEYSDRELTRLQRKADELLEGLLGAPSPQGLEVAPSRSSPRIPDGLAPDHHSAQVLARAAPARHSVTAVELWIDAHAPATEEPLAVAFFVAGEPAPQGSKSAFRNPRSERIQMRESSKRTAPWRSDVKAVAERIMDGRDLILGPVGLELRFVFRRPAGHFGVRGLLPSAPAHKVSAPDTSKLVRAVEDALTGIVWGDDRQVVRLSAEKIYGEKPGAHVVVRVIG